MFLGCLLAFHTLGSASNSKKQLANREKGHHYMTKLVASVVKTKLASGPAVRGAVDEGWRINYVNPV